MKQIKIYNKNIHGIDVVYVRVPFSLTSHVGFFSLSGSYAENEKNQGISHYLEHMFFKGTNKRNCFQISDDAALLGANENAYTSEYNTQYYMNVPSINTEEAIELLCDMMFNPSFPEEEIEKERTVIQEERKMYEDNHQSHFFEETQNNFFKFDVGHRIIGTEETINSFNRNDFVEYRNQMYGLDNTILVIVSDLSHSDIFKFCDRQLSGNPFFHNGLVPIQSEIIQPSDRIFSFKRKNIQQSYLVGLFEGNGKSDKNTTKRKCMINSIGGGMFSIFFKELREKLGLCYSVSSFDFLSNSDKTVMGYFCQTDPKKSKIAMEKMIEINSDIRKNGFQKSVFECSKAEQIGGFCRATSNIANIANVIGKNKLMGIETNFEEDYDSILSLTIDDVNEYAMKYLPKDEEIYWSIMSPEE